MIIYGLVSASILCTILGLYDFLRFQSKTKKTLGSILERYSKLVGCYDRRVKKLHELALCYMNSLSKENVSSLLHARRIVQRQLMIKAQSEKSYAKSNFKAFPELIEKLSTLTNSGRSRAPRKEAHWTAQVDQLLNSVGCELDAIANNCRKANIPGPHEQIQSQVKVCLLR